MMKEEGKQHKWEGESYFSIAKREGGGGGHKAHTKKLVICRVQRTSMHQTAREMVAALLRVGSNVARC